MADRASVLVTGAGGQVARRVIDDLANSGWSVTGLDRPGVTPHPACEVWYDGDVTDQGDVDRALSDAVVIVHAAAVFDAADPSGADLLRVNIGGAYNVLDTARHRPGTRVVLFSEAPVHLPPTGEKPERSWQSSNGDDHLYDLSKRLQEEAARDFCQTFGMDVVALRIGHVVDGAVGADFAGGPLSGLDYCRGGWVCCHDVARACVAAVQIDERPGFIALPVVGSAAGYERFGVDETERVLGIQLRETFSQYAR